MKKPYRDKYGRFAKQPKTKRTKHVQFQKTKSSFPSHVDDRTRKRLRRIRSTPKIKTKPHRKKETAPSRKRVSKKKPLTVTRRKKKEKWEDLNDILDSYIEEMDLEEDDIGGSP